MLLVDGMQADRYDREVLQELVAGGLAATGVTLGYWEDALETMDAIVRWNDLARDNADLITIARSVADIEAAASSGRTAILLGSQTAALFADRLGFVELFHAMGVRIVQLTYNNQNAIGGSCYEEPDSGLSRFGVEVVREMNRVGVLVDISHVGERTGLDAIERSSVPVAATHANPASLFPHRRNKSDDLLRALAERGGVVGLNTCKHFTGAYVETAASWVDLLCRTVDLVGVDAVAVGSDLGSRNGEDELRWMRQGRWTRANESSVIVSGGPPLPDEWLRTAAQFGEIVDELRRTGRFTEDEVAAIAGGNWLRVYRAVFG